MENPLATTESQPRKAAENFDALGRSFWSAQLRVLSLVNPFLGIASGALLYACHFPLGWGWLGWVALVPLLCLVRTAASRWNVYLSAWLGGLAFFWPALAWMRVADYRMVYTWAALATYCSLFFPLNIYLVRTLDRRTRLPLVITLPVVWTALEFFRANFGTGFAWYLLGYTQQSFLALIQISDLAGVYAVTFLVAAVNALVFELLYSRRWFRSFLSLPDLPAWSGRWPLSLSAAAVLLMLGASLAYGSWRLGQNRFTVGPVVALIQGNLDQRIRNAATENDADTAARTMVEHYAKLCEQAASQQPKPDLIIWPETSFPYDWQELSPDFPAEDLSPAGRTIKDSLLRRPGINPDNWRSFLTYALNHETLTRMRRYQTNILLGLNTVVETASQKRRRYNSALLLEADGRISGRYDKIHRVPFGEYVPLRDWLPWMNAFAPYDFDYSISPGKHLTRLALGKYHFGVVICFEDTDPELARQYGRAGDDGPAADFLLNISNDGWFNGSSEHEEHLAICRFRAIECRRAVGRAVNMGISAVIDSNGRVVALPGPTWKASKKIAAVLLANMPIDKRTSLYTLWGDWLCWTCWGVLLAALAWTFRRRPRGNPAGAGGDVL